MNKLIYAYSSMQSARWKNPSI